MGAGKRYAQETKTKYGHKHQLLSPWYFQVTDHGQRHAADSEVGNKVDAGHDIPYGQLVKAVALDRGIPELGHGYTYQR
jgi:hypothetical protein